MTSEPRIDPSTSRMLERARKLDHYDDLRVQRAALTAFLAGLLVGICFEVVRSE